MDTTTDPEDKQDESQAVGVVIGQQNIIPNAIKTRHLAKSTAIALGDLYYGDGNGNFARLAPSATSNAFLKTSTTVAPAWSTVNAVGLISATTTIDVSAATAPSSGQVLTATSSTTATWQTVTTGQATIIAPNTIATNDGGGTLTTSGTTELTIISKTITNPSAAGQLLATAVFDRVSPTVANDFFQYKLYFGGNVIAVITDTIDNTGGGGRRPIPLTAQCAVANSGTQIIKMTVTRDTGTGTVSFENARNFLTWTIFPGASTTA